ncbi:hypothetical protein HANVADRAFT_51443 [Hanseniaspora valbyensis NRRL Y-1626]|uniref:Uncharacterized protein n=1 Tax=Hanseniaspora valbyensis NRRL Y-1626 TaxID=766949 RepID=A0A1B7TIH1_9ASCO|nr:hypothetical protein HANVADRAFT_51443 [Hanseniaspora valbyensis NRRL Y-1626]
MSNNNNRKKVEDTSSNNKSSGKYRKNRLETYLNEAKISNTETKNSNTELSNYERKRIYKNEDKIDIDSLSKIKTTEISDDSFSNRLSRYELLERTLLNLPLNKLLKDTSANSIRSIKDKPVYTKSSFIAKYGNDIKTKSMEDIESNFVYDPKSKLVKDETKGFYNNKNGKYYRYLNSEGQELKELEDSVRRENILNSIKQKQKLKKERTRLSKEEFEKINDKRNEVLFANPTLLSKKTRKRQLEEEDNGLSNENSVKKRDLSQMSAKKTSNGKKMNMDLLSKYK